MAKDLLSKNIETRRFSLSYNFIELFLDDNFIVTYFIFFLFVSFISIVGKAALLWHGCLENVGKKEWKWWV